jgi:hypothetical protein
MQIACEHTLKSAAPRQNLTLNRGAEVEWLGTGSGHFKNVNGICTRKLERHSMDKIRFGENAKLLASDD